MKKSPRNGQNAGETHVQQPWDMRFITINLHRTIFSPVCISRFCFVFPCMLFLLLVAQGKGSPSHVCSWLLSCRSCSSIPQMV